MQKLDTSSSLSANILPVMSNLSALGIKNHQPTSYDNDNLKG